MFNKVLAAISVSDENYLLWKACFYFRSLKKDLYHLHKLFKSLKRLRMEIFLHQILVCQTLGCARISSIHLKWNEKKNLTVGMIPTRFLKGQMKWKRPSILQEIFVHKTSQEMWQNLHLSVFWKYIIVWASCWW